MLVVGLEKKRSLLFVMREVVFGFMNERFVVVMGEVRL